jgi:hypothetical protein
MRRNVPEKRCAATPAVTTSEAGDARVDVVFDSTREQSIVLGADGYSWDKVARVMVRVVAGDRASVEDLLRADGLRVGRNANGETVLTNRAFLLGAAFKEINTACNDGGFAHRTRIGWVKETTAEVHAALAALVGERSQERADRARREAAAAAAEAARDTAREAAQETRTMARQRAEAADPTLERRRYSYSKLLLRMQATETVSYGGDGAPCWPDPPKAGEEGVVSDATVHLMPSLEEMTRAEARRSNGHAGAVRVRRR